MIKIHRILGSQDGAVQYEPEDGSSDVLFKIGIYLIRKKHAVGSSETAVFIYQPTRNHVSEDYNLGLNSLTGLGDEASE